MLRRADSAYDLVLSSGFLAFASHSGFLKAVEAAGLHVSGVMGTSAGALSGSLYCAGYSPDAVRHFGSRLVHFSSRQRKNANQEQVVWEWERLLPARISTAPLTGTA